MAEGLMDHIMLAAELRRQFEASEVNEVLERIRVMAHDPLAIMLIGLILHETLSDSNATVFRAALAARLAI